MAVLSLPLRTDCSGGIRVAASVHAAEPGLMVATEEAVVAAKGPFAEREAQATASVVEAAAALRIEAAVEKEMLTPAPAVAAQLMTIHQQLRRPFSKSAAPAPPAPSAEAAVRLAGSTADAAAQADALLSSLHVLARKQQQQQQQQQQQ